VKAQLLPAVKAQPVPSVKALPSLLTMGQDAALETDPHVHILDQLEPTGMDVEEKEGEQQASPCNGNGKKDHEPHDGREGERKRDRKYADKHGDRPSQE